MSSFANTDLQYLVKTIRVLYARGGYDSVGIQSSLYLPRKSAVNKR